MVAAAAELGLSSLTSKPAQFLITSFDADRLGDYLSLAAGLRRAGLGVEVYPEPRKLGQQLKYADRRGFRFAIIAGSRELEAGVCQLKDLRDGSTVDLPLSGDQLPSLILDRLRV